MIQTLLIPLEFNELSESRLIHLIQYEVSWVFLWVFNCDPVLNYWMTVKLLSSHFPEFLIFSWKQKKNTFH